LRALQEGVCHCPHWVPGHPDTYTPLEEEYEDRVARAKGAIRTAEERESEAIANFRKVESGQAGRAGAAKPVRLKPYNEGRGHHIPAKSAFEGAPNFNKNTVLAIPKAVLKLLKINHNIVTGAQMTGYRAFAKTGAKLTWEAMEDIETNALVKGGLKDVDVARATVRQAIQALQKAGVPGPTRIPWVK
jgi:hypothetical protein